MFLCRSARLTLLPLARKSPAGFCRNVVPRRPMSSGVPGGSGENFVYFALCGVSLTAGLAYAYRTVTEDRTRYNDRVTELQARPKHEWQPKLWPPKESEAEEAGGDEGEETPAEEAAAVEAPLEAADGSEVVEAEPALVEAEPVSVETVNEPSGADLEAALAEAMEEAPASTESDARTPAVLSAIETVSEVEAAESVGMPVSCVGVEAEMLEDVAGEIMEEKAEEPKQNQLGTATGPEANRKDLMETQAVMGVVSERESVVLADDTPTASTEADEEKSVVLQLVPEAKEASTESIAEMSLVEETASTAAIEEESVVGEPVPFEEPAADTTAKGSEVNVKEAVDTTEVKESTAATVEDPEVFISNVEPISTSKKEPAPDSTAEEPVATVEEEAGDATKAKDSAATVVEEPDVFSSAEEPASTYEEGPAPDSTAEGSEVSVDYEMVDTSEAKESIVIVTEEPVVFTYKVEPAPDSSAEGPLATLEEEAGNGTEAKDSAAAVVAELEMFSSTEEALSSEEEEPAPDSAAEGLVASLEEEPAEAPTESITLNEVKSETLDSSIHPPENIPENKPAAASPINLTEETLSSKDEFSQVVEAEISPDVEVQSNLEAMKSEANLIMEAAETKDEDCPIVENSKPVLNTTVLAEEVAQKATEKVQAHLMGTETAEPKRTPAKEYIVVVLEDAPKEPKKPKVLPIAPITASVPSPKVKDP
ncbi:uncharacterized protein mgarpa isoform X2 [Paramormyrops kingsleyae]|uniref:uncharacterized protein mgarpa isoform X2 n=1 Tax=Paramormyrops kingsleyae TaxID=1676925 RepID=UPI000CD5F566|nr:protein MGARP isoform X2 [Paramormyrops kingsleyae]